jgi:putative endonuclease
MPYFVYLLECNDTSIYTGITTDINRRFREHREKTASRYTAAKGAKKMLYSEQFPTRSAALKREAEIKKWSRAKKLAIAKRIPVQNA